MNIPASFLDKAFVLAKEKNKTLVSSLEQNLVNGDLYLQLGAGGIEKVYFKYEEKVQKVSCRVHSGMFTDSYLYTILGVVDFRHYEFIGVISLEIRLLMQMWCFIEINLSAADSVILYTDLVQSTVL